MKVEYLYPPAKASGNLVTRRVRADAARTVASARAGRGSYGRGGTGDGPGVVVSAEPVRPWYGFS
jgi:hypothetical protein